MNYKKILIYTLFFFLMGCNGVLKKKEIIVPDKLFFSRGSDSFSFKDYVSGADYLVIFLGISGLTAGLFLCI